MGIFPIQDLLSYTACYSLLLNLLHREGFLCPCGSTLLSQDSVAHKKNKSGLASYRCSCKRVFNIYTGTIFQGIHYDCATLILILRGIIKGDSTQSLSKELKINYKNLLDWRPILQEFAFENRFITALPDSIAESDEVFINAGEKGVRHSQPHDPPRVGANKKKE